ncbi:MAG: OadG family protein [Firmicutes bacterium]|nr:OadG family protein [Bacillota bacterium]
MSNLAVGVELLITGMLTTFLVLILLMYIMKATSTLIARQAETEAEPAVPSPQLAQEPSTELGDAELVAIMAALGKVLPAGQQAVVRVTPLAATGAEEEEMVAAIAGALAAR